MAIKLLENIGIENTGIGASALNNLITGNKSGIVGNYLNECAFTATGNTIIIDKGLLIICGRQVELDAIESITLSSVPSGEDVRYQIVIELIREESGEVTASIFVRQPSTLIQENLMKDGFVYQFELGRVTHTTSGKLEDIIRTADILTSGSSGGADFEIGEVITETLSEGLDAEVDIEKRQVDNKQYIDFNFSIPKGVNISTTMPLSSASASNSKVLSEKVVYDEFAARTFTRVYSNLTEIDASYTGNTPIPTVYDKMVENSMAIYKLETIASAYPDIEGVCEIYKINEFRGFLRYTKKTWNSTTAIAMYFGSLLGTAGNAGRWSGWKQLALTNNPTFTGTVTVPTPNNSTDATNKAYVDSLAISGLVKQPNRTYVLYYATAGANNLYLSVATYEHTYASAGAYLITISGTGSSATVDWGDGTSETVNFTGGFKVNKQADKDKYIEVYLGTNCAVIGTYAFRNCAKLTSVTIPDNVTSINSYAFQYCSGLTSVTIPNSVISIGDYAFYNCSSLTSVTIPDNVTSIDTGAFQNCTKLTSITIPNSVTIIGSSAFQDCSGLTSINFLGSTIPTIGSVVFEGCRIADIIVQTSELADIAVSKITNAGGRLFENYRQLY